jgi:hypothetical protein
MPRFHTPGILATALALSRCDQKNTGMHKEAEHTVESPVEARQGFLDRPVLVVLGISLSLILVLYAAIYLGFFGTS